MSDIPRTSAVLQSGRETAGPGPATIERCVAAWQRARAALAGDEHLAVDEQAIAEALDADPTILRPDELLRRIVRALVFAELGEAEAKTLAAMLQARQHRYAKRGLWLRTELFEVMQALERKSFAAPYGTVSIRDGTASVLITDENAIPDKYINVTVVRQPDKRALLAALKALEPGEFIPGAVLSNGAPTLALIRPRLLAEPEAQAEEQ